MAAKKKKPKRPKETNPGPKKPRKKKRHHHHGGAARAAAAALPAGMVMMPVSALGTVRNPAPAKKKRKHHHGPKHHHPHHHPRKHNPEPSHHLKQVALAVGFGFAGAAAGMTAGYAIERAGLQSKWAKTAANTGAGVLMGGALALADRTAGTVVAHNYAVAAIQAALSSDSKGVAPAMRQNARYPGVTGAPRPKQLHGPDALDGVVADNMGDADELGAYEKLEGVVADNMGDAEELGAYEKLEGISTEEMGEADPIGAYEKLEGVVADNMGEPGDLEGEDDIAELDDVGDPDLF